MRKWARSIRNHRGDLVVGVLKMITYAGLFFAFFLLMSINNWPLRNLSRTLGTTVITWFAMTIAMNSVYGGYQLLP